MLQLPGLFEQTGLYVTAALFFGGLVYFLTRDLRRFRWPTRHDINRRIETESGLKHRPISGDDDTPVTSSTPQSYELWLIEKQRRERDIAKVGFVRWREHLSAHDRYGLRLIAVLVFCAGFLVAGTQWNNRILQGLIPLDWDGSGSDISPMIVTITPPEYTQLSQIVLQNKEKPAEPVAIPEQSTLNIILSDALMHPRVINQGQSIPMNRIEDGGYDLEWVAELPENHEEDRLYELTVKQFFYTNYGFEYKIIRDKAPKIALQPLSEQEIAALEKQKADRAEWEEMRGKMEKMLEEDQRLYHPKDLPRDEPSAEEDGTEENETIEAETAPPTATEEDLPKEREPTILADGQIQVPLVLRDDYGVKTLTMDMRLSDDVTDPPLGYPVTQERSIMSPPAQDFKISPVYDFTDNPWAGLPVTIDFTAEDATGQTTALATIKMVLPEREFKHPVAKQLVSLRKELAWAPVAAAPQVQYELERMLQFPQDFQNDLIVYMALRTAASRLHYSAATQSDMFEDSRAVMALLWDAALRIEGGNLSIAARNLRYAQMALESALRDPDISQEDITALMGELRQSMGAYLQEFQKELQKKFAEGEPLLLTPEALEDLMDPDALAQFLGSMENEMRSGNNQRAQGMLSQLQRMLDMLNPNMTLPMPDDMQFMADSVSELQQLIDKQTALLEQTETQSENLARLNEARDFGNLLPNNMELLLQWGLDDLPPPPSLHDTPKTLPGLDTELNQYEQEALRYVLGQLMLETDRFMGKIPEKMGLAEREMYFSTEDLSASRPDESVPHQELAIQYLTEAQQEMQDELAERIEQMTGGDQNGESMPGGKKPFSGLGERFSQGRQYDPLGRPLDEGSGGSKDGQYPDSNVKIPDEAERKRVEEILRTLRERSGELFRPREELEYFRRLLRQF